MERNVLYYGDNLGVLRQHVADDSVYLVDLDPPFKSNQDDNFLFAEIGTRSAAQVEAFVAVRDGVAVCGYGSWKAYRAATR